MNNQLEELRLKIDEADSKLLSAFKERMEVSAAIAACKKEIEKPVLDKKRELAKLEAMEEEAGEEMASYTKVLYSLLFELSRNYQNRILGETTPTQAKILDAIKNTNPLFPQTASVACQGAEGAYAQLACEKMFKNPKIQYLKDFEHVFRAIESGLCNYGVVPIENSTAGSVKKIYDLMISHDFQIVRSTRMKIDHNLLAAPGATLDSIKEIYSHEQAIGQCSRFLSQLKNVNIIPCANTAVAARMVAESGRTDIAAIASRKCIDLYDLRIVDADIQDTGNNFTRFICISKKPEIYPGANRTSIMMTLPNTAGSLYKMLEKFYALDISLNKLESRPIPERDFEFMFYFDLDVSVYSPEFIQLMGDLQGMGGDFRYLGSYSEVI